MTNPSSAPTNAAHSVRITVSGSAQFSYPPQRCTVQLRIVHEAPSKPAAHTATAQRLTQLQELVAGQYDPERGPINWWSADQLVNSQRRPFNNAGKQLPFVYSTAVAMEVKFRDLTRVSGFVDQVGEIGGVNIVRLDWALATVSRDSHLAGARDAAVRDAVAKATGYAQSLGLNSIRPVALADPGLLSQPQPAAMYGARMVAAATESEIELKPQYITLSAAVEAVFEAS